MLKTVLITGASSGFGACCAKRFAAAGWQLILVARRGDRLQELADTLDVPTHVIVLDVRDKEAIAASVASIPEAFSRIDVLVNNAGLALGLAPSQSASMEDWETMVDTNIKGLLYFTRSILPDMVARNTGHVVNMGSVAGSWPYPGGNTYGATKAFVAQFSRNLRSDLLGTGVRVTNIEPGMAETEFSVVRFKGDQEKADATYEGVAPLTGEDIAEIVFWVTNQPAHVNINSLEVMPTQQAWGPFMVSREKA